MTTLHTALRAWANGAYPLEAGTELLIRHGKAIYDGAPWITAQPPVTIDGPPTASIDVDTLLDHAGAWSGGEQRVVHIAASLLGGPAVDLQEALSGLDRRATDLVLAAVAHAAGSHQMSGAVYDNNGRITGFTPLAGLYDWPA